MSIDSINIRQYLEGKGLQLKNAGRSNVHTHCMFCDEPTDKRGRLYINVDDQAEIRGLFHCLTGDTKVVTWDGLRPIAELAGGTHKIMTQGGRWVDAPVHDFGRQQVWQVVVSRNGRHQTIGATDEHRWLLRSQSGPNRERFTRDLKPGDRLAYAYGQGIKSVRPSRFGAAAGLVFGDGTRKHSGSCIDLHGDKNRALEPFFNGAHSYECETDGRSYRKIVDLPAAFKDLPDLDESRSYLAGWLAGYIAADGSVSTDGQVELWSAEREHLEFVEKLCIRIGIGTYGVTGPYERTGQATNFGDRPLWRIGFLRDTLTADMLIVEEHRRRFEAHDPAYTRKGWVVQSVTRTDQHESVYCAVVPEHESFVIAGNILTGNCKLCDKKGALPTILRQYGDYEQYRGDSSEENTEQRRAILEAATVFYMDALGNCDRTFKYEHDGREYEHTPLEYLQGPSRGLSMSTIVDRRIGWANGGKDLFVHLRKQGFETRDIMATGVVVELQSGLMDSLYGMVTIPYELAGNVVQVRGRAFPYDGEGPKYKTCGGNTARLFNADRTWDTKEIVITEGEFDTMIVEQLGYPAVGVPGANTWQDHWDGYMQDQKRVFVLFDRDTAGETGAEKLRDRFGSKVREIHLSEPGIKMDPTSWVCDQGGNPDEFAAKVERARAGGMLVTVDDARQEHAELQGQEGLKFGIEQLDMNLEPGLLDSQVAVVLAKTGTGKQHPRSEPICTPDGVQRFGDLQVGDLVFGRDGSPTEVTGVFPQGVTPTYRVSFSDGTSALAGREHLWTVEYRYGRKREWCRTKTLTTEQLLEVGLRAGHNDAEWRWRIPICEPVQYDVRSLPVEAYTLGAYIANGCGTKGSVVITTPDEEVIDRIGRHHQASEHARHGCRRWGVLGLIGPIRQLGLDVRSSDKFIPAIYLTGSVEQRVALLQGLMDGDGTSSASGRSCVRYSTTSQQLADDMVQLVSSLGGTAVRQWRDRSHEGKTDECTLSIMLPDDIEPFSLSRKRRGGTVNRTAPHRAIVAIERVEDQDSMCISVAAHDSLYLIGREHVVTHNTISMLNMMQTMRMVPGQEDLKFLFVSLEQTRGDWWERARRIYRFYNLRDTDEDAADFWRDNMLLVDKNRVKPEEFLTILEDYEYQVGDKPDCVFIDYLGYWAQSFQGERYQRTSDAIMSLKEVAKDQRLKVVTPHQVSRVAKFGEEPEADAARDAGVVEETADFMFSLWNPDTQLGTAEEEKSGMINMRIAKSRHGGRGAKIAYQFAPISLALVPHGSGEFVTRAKEELDYERMYHDSFDDVILRHRSGATGRLDEEARERMTQEAF